MTSPPVAPGEAEVGGDIEYVVPAGFSTYTGPPFSDNPTELGTPAHGFLQAGSLNPPRAALGAPDFTLMFIGQGFVDGAKIVWNGSEEPTTYVSPQVVTTVVKPSTATVETVVPVHVLNPDGGRTRDLSFSFAGQVWVPPAPPVPPTVTAVTPATVNLVAGSGNNPTPFTITGTGFTAASEVRVATAAAPGTWFTAGSVFVSPTELTVNIVLAAGTAAGTWQFAVRDNGLTSAPFPVTVTVA